MKISINELLDQLIPIPQRRRFFECGDNVLIVQKHHARWDRERAQRFERRHPKHPQKRRPQEEQYITCFGANGSLLQDRTILFPKRMKCHEHLGTDAQEQRTPHEKGHRHVSLLLSSFGWMLRLIDERCQTHHISEDLCACCAFDRIITGSENARVIMSLDGHSEQVIGESRIFRKK